MVKRFGRKLNLILMMVAVLTVAYVSALAAPSGTIQVIVEDPVAHPVADINVELFQVTTCSNGVCTLSQDFASLGIAAQQLHDAPDAVHAEQAFQYAYAHGLNGTVRHTDERGCVDFYGLEEGIYLVCEYGGQVVSFQPFLVTIPAWIGEEKEYFVISKPKTSDTDVRTLVCVKLWEDELDAAGKRPDSIKITLLRDGVSYRTATLTEATGWQHKFHMLPESGTYTVKEDPIQTYEAEYLPAIEGYIVVNTYVPGGGGGGGGGGGEDPENPPAHLSVSKVWNDKNDAAGKRPKSITVQLILNGTVVRTATLSKANSWKYTFTGLDGTKSYTVKEITVPEYSAVYQGTAATGITIVNTFSGTTDPGTPPPPVIPNPQRIDIPVRVEWIDQNNAEGKRPDTVIVSLISNGSVIAVLQLDASTDWTGVFRDVPADLPYMVWQNAVSEYTTIYSGDAASGFVVTNIYTEGTTDPGIPEEPTEAPVPEQPTEGPVVEQPTENPVPEYPTEIPEEPTQPVVPPVEPTIPQTGAEVFSVYLLMAAGILLVLLGLVDIYRGRECYEEED